MEVQEIKKRNIALQELLGWKLECLNPDAKIEDDTEFFHYQFNRYENGRIVEVDCGGDSWSWEKDDTIPFNSNWNRLMKAVEKIETQGCSVGITIDGCCITSYLKAYGEYETCAMSENMKLSKIENTFIACSDFAIEYLKQKNDQRRT